MDPLAGRSRAQIAVYVGAAVLLVLAGLRYLDRSGGDAPAPTVALDESGAGPADAPGGAAADRVFVHVAGAVKDPGLYRLPEGLRVGAAIHRAGGTTARADVSAVNLAGEVQDGQQVLVPGGGSTPTTAAPPSTSTVPTTSTTGAPTAPVSLAQATPEQLDASVEGIGPTLAAAIIEFRDERGSVSSIDELAEVDGIGETRLAALREALVP